jgi:taurine dioxygenase
VLENDKDRPSLIEQWHTDMTFRPCPPLGSVLHGLVIPPHGKGDTEFLSLSAALEVVPRCACFFFSNAFLLHILLGFLFFSFCLQATC